eukprot:3538803-Pleurochrysis_carterae.AAC.2
MVLSLSPPLACTASYPAARRPIYARPLNLPGGQISERTDQRQALAHVRTRPHVRFALAHACVCAASRARDV